MCVRWQDDEQNLLGLRVVVFTARDGETKNVELHRSQINATLR